jgi:methylmalonyl-CoA mutase cobalamin-binding subunit
VPTDPTPRRVVVAGTVPEVEPDLVRHARTLRDAGVEVIWVGVGLAPAEVAAVAVSEDVAAVVVAPTSAVDAVTQALSRLEADDIDVAALPT